MINEFLTDKQRRQIELRKTMQALSESSEKMTREAREKEEQRLIEAASRMAISQYSKKRKQKLFEDTANYEQSLIYSAMRDLAIQLTMDSLLLDNVEDFRSRVVSLIDKMFEAGVDVSTNGLALEIIKYIPEYNVGVNLDRDAIVSNILNSLNSNMATQLNAKCDDIENQVTDMFMLAAEEAKTIKDKIHAIKNSEEDVSTEAIDFNNVNRLISLARNDAIFNYDGEKLEAFDADKYVADAVADLTTICALNSLGLIDAQSMLSKI